MRVILGRQGDNIAALSKFEVEALLTACGVKVGGHGTSKRKHLDKKLKRIIQANMHMEKPAEASSGTDLAGKDGYAKLLSRFCATIREIRDSNREEYG
eukprot:SAG31_NODE_30949_length_374_cov_0.825455_1_plen_97_part_01